MSGVRPCGQSEPVEAVVEVDRLPRVEDDGPRALRVARPRAHERVQRRTQTIETAVEPGRVQPRRRVGLAVLEHDLGRAEQLGGTEGAGAVGQPLRPVGGVTAPAQVHAPHLAGAKGESRRPGDHEQRRVVAGASLASLAQPRPLAERAALGSALAAPAAGEVEDLARHRGEGQRDAELVGAVRRGALVAQHVAHPHHAGRLDLELAAQRQLRALVARVDRDAVLAGCHAGQREPGRPAAAVRTGPRQPRPTAVSAGAIGHERRDHGDVEPGQRQARRRRQRQRLDVGDDVRAQCTTYGSPGPRASSTSEVPPPRRWTSAIAVTLQPS
jgi:hypothetical protein